MILLGRPLGVLEREVGVTIDGVNPGSTPKVGSTVRGPNHDLAATIAPKIAVTDIDDVRVAGPADLVLRGPLSEPNVFQHDFGVGHRAGDLNRLGLRDGAGAGFRDRVNAVDDRALLDFEVSGRGGLDGRLCRCGLVAHGHREQNLQQDGHPLGGVARHLRHDGLHGIGWHRGRDSSGRGDRYRRGHGDSARDDVAGFVGWRLGDLDRGEVQRALPQVCHHAGHFGRGRLIEAPGPRPRGGGDQVCSGIKGGGVAAAITKVIALNEQDVTLGRVTNGGEVELLALPYVVPQIDGAVGAGHADQQGENQKNDHSGRGEKVARFHVTYLL